MKDFRQLSTWQKSHQLALVLYERTRSFPREEMYGLTGQIRRAATSIPANLAEGCGRDGDAELARYLEYHLLLAHDLKLLQSEDYMQLTERVVELKRMLTALIQELTAERSQLFRRLRVEPAARRATFSRRSLRKSLNPFTVTSLHLTKYIIRRFLNRPSESHGRGDRAKSP